MGKGERTKRVVGIIYYGRAKTSALWWLRSFVLHTHAPGLSHFVTRRLE
jgi:hypothetical protein